MLGEPLPPPPVRLGLTDQPPVGGIGLRDDSLHGQRIAPVGVAVGLRVATKTSWAQRKLFINQPVAQFQI
jgi:hypothetical protein